MKPLYERYRPKTLDEIAAHPRIIASLKRIQASSGLAGRAYFIVGTSGTGKTTIGRIIAAHVAAPYATTEIDAQDVNLELVRQWEDQMQGKPLGIKRHWCVVINEAHGLSGKVVRRLLTILENEYIQRNSTWVFTTTIAGEGLLFDKDDASPLVSRCLEIRLEHGPELELEFAIRARKVAQAENLDGKEVTDYVRLVRECKCNFRQTLQRIEAGEMLE